MGLKTLWRVWYRGTDEIWHKVTEELQPITSGFFERYEDAEAAARRLTDSKEVLEVDVREEKTVLSLKGAANALEGSGGDGDADVWIVTGLADDMQVFTSEEKAAARATQQLRESIADLKSRVWKDDDLEAQKINAITKIEDALSRNDLDRALTAWTDFAFPHELGIIQLSKGKLCR